MTTCDNCGLSCSNPIMSTLGTACSYACSMALVGKHPEFFARCLQCGKPVGKNPIPHGTEGWTCDPSCDVSYIMSKPITNPIIIPLEAPRT